VTEVEFESDAFLKLLTEALRAGPGSPSWHTALARLREQGISSSDEYRLLVKAREHLESGLEYRSVRAGPEFSRKLLASIEEEAVPQRQPRATRTIALASAAVLLIVLGLIGYLLLTAGNRPGSTGPLVLTDTAASLEFNSPIAPPWQPIGALPLESARGALRLKPGDPSAGTGGGIAWQQTIPPGEPFAVTANLRVRSLQDDLIAQVFISDTPQFSPDNSTTPHELVWLMQGRQIRVILPNGRISDAKKELVRDYRGNILVRITIDQDQGTIDVGGKTMWSDPHGLDPGKPRTIGVRFLRRSNSAGDGVNFQSLRINTRQN
jgi:hypothetical protein